MVGGWGTSGWYHLSSQDRDLDSAGVNTLRVGEPEERSRDRDDAPHLKRAEVAASNHLPAPSRRISTHGLHTHRLASSPFARGRCASAPHAYCTLASASSNPVTHAGAGMGRPLPMVRCARGGRTISTLHVTATARMAGTRFESGIISVRCFMRLRHASAVRGTYCWYFSR